MRCLTLLSLLAVSATALVVERGDPNAPASGVAELPGWPECPECAIAVFEGGADLILDVPVCARADQTPPCSYYYCCGEEPVTCGVYKEICAPGNFDVLLWTPSELGK